MGKTMQKTLKSIRTTAFAIGMAAASFAFAPSHADAASLKSLSVVEGGVLKLGDIFDGLSTDKAEYAIGYAPAPGEELVINTRTLLHLAIKLDVPWRPASSVDQVTIRSAATVVPAHMIEKAVHERLKENVSGEFQLSFNGTPPKLVLPQGDVPEFSVAKLNYNKRYDYFEAELVAPNEDNPLTRATISGKVYPVVKVPVLREAVSYGYVIGAEDIMWSDMKMSDLGENTVLQAEDLIGMTPRRIAYADRPLLRHDLQRPQLVSRGDNVTIVYDYGPMKLSAKGKALESGSKEDNIRVVNVASNRTIDAFVIDSGVVTVTP